MTDPLGQSQVIPYVEGLAKAGYDMTILSCEKNDKFAEKGEYIKDLLKTNNIKWETFFFTSSPPILAKMYDLWQLKSKAEKLHKKNNYSMTHCRSYVSAQAGLLLKKKYGVKFLFDIRGFWVDERVDGGLWNLQNPFYKFLYNDYKKKEADFISNCDGLVSLTQNGKKEMLTWKSYRQQPLFVIPCSADFELFTLTSVEQKIAARKKLNIDKDNFVLSYLGSIGTWYMIEEMMQFFILLKKKYANAKFLFVTNGEYDKIKSVAAKHGISKDDLNLTSAPRKEVGDITKACDMSISFIKPCYSKISSSPTKLGELLAMGIPVISNSGVGDVKEIIEQTNSGICIDDFSLTTMAETIERIPALLQQINHESIRQKAKDIYDLSNAQEKYISLYKTILN
jgi:glycosyltransferase involved in cell wall biosynthesis